MKEKSHIRGLLERHVPPALLPWLDDSFIASCGLIEQYVQRLAIQVLRDTELEHACTRYACLDEIMAAAELPPGSRVAVQWLLATLASCDYLDRQTDADGVTRFRLRAEFPSLDPAALIDEQRRIDPRCLPAYTIAALAAEHYPSVLRGQSRGEEALFGPHTLDAWCDYFSNDNPLYAIANRIGALQVSEHLEQGKPATILEIGAGLGSGAEALWQHLCAAGRSSDIADYRFTELSAVFKRRAQKRLRVACAEMPLNFSRLDIDEPFEHAGVAPGSCDLVYGVNVLHAARDLAVSLAEIRTALRPDGTLVISECVRPFDNQPVYVEFVFNLLNSFCNPVLVSPWRPTGGFLTPEQWQEALEANGFTGVSFLPDVAALRGDIPAFVVAGIAARRN